MWLLQVTAGPRYLPMVHPTKPPARKGHYIVKPLPAAALQDALQRRFVAEVEGAWLRSTLADWMRQHHAELAALMAEHREDWHAIATECGRAGLMDLRGREPTPETAEGTWRRVVAQMKGRRR